MTSVDTDYNVLYYDFEEGNEMEHDVFVFQEEKKEEKNQNKQRTRIPFSIEEDHKLIELVLKYGIDKKKNWQKIATNMKGRNVRQCRERYNLFLRENVRKKIIWTKEEDELLLLKYSLLGPRWKTMEEFFKGRNSYSIKNRFISLNRKKHKNDNENSKNPKIYKTSSSSSSNDNQSLISIINHPTDNTLCAENKGTLEEETNDYQNLFFENDENDLIQNNFIDDELFSYVNHSFYF